MDAHWRFGRMVPRAVVLTALAAPLVTLAGLALPASTASAAVTGSQRPPGFLSVQGELVAVTTISSSDAWAVGDTAIDPLKPVLVHWDGSKWAVVRSPALPMRGRLFGVAKFRGGAFAVGNSGGGIGTFQPLILRLTGATARRVPTPNLRGGMLLGVAATSAKNAWAVGKISRGPALILHWNGTAWRRTALPGALGVKELGRVAATSAANAWAIGTTRRGGPLILHWNGRRWSRAAFPAPGGTALQLAGLAATSAANAWAVGFTGGVTNTSRTVVLHWDGKRWKRVPSPNPTGGSEGDGFLGVSASSARNAWAVGAGFQGELMTQHWGGTAWKTVRTPAEPGILFGVSIGPSGRAWAVGQTPGSPTVETLILHWNGTAWH